MDTSALKKFAQQARRLLLTQVEARLEVALTQDTAELRGKTREQVALRERLAKIGRDALVEEAAYTWFNRLIALRFMDAREYTRIRVVSPMPGHTLPEILFEAKKGHIDEELTTIDRQQVLDLLDGRILASDAQNEVYRLLLLAVCNRWHRELPFLFETLGGWSELLMPVDLLGPASVTAAINETITDADCAEVEIIGWLYQYYISEKKDEVFAALKKNKKITPANIPAATQLFTPNWIVRYMVQNSLGRLWLESHPQSALARHMDFFITGQNPRHGRGWGSGAKAPRKAHQHC